MGFKEVILTDVEECLETLASNVRANCPAKDFEVVVNFPNQAIGITGYGEIPPPRTSSLSSPRVTSNPKQEPSASTTAPVAIGTPAAVPDGPESGLRNRTSSVPDGAASVPDGLGVDHVGGEKGPISGSGTSLGKEGTAWSATAEEKNLASVCASAVDESDDDDDDGDDRLGEMETKNPKLIEPRNNVGLCNGCKSGGGISDGLAVREKTVSDVRTERTVVRVEELDWYRGVDHVKPPFDYIIASDVVYSVSADTLR
ncbi:hypothetical protein CBR_g46430 [Chara braunii]|uniref:Uncharacterized protein n=1 Tax=Chara braunii TaxID=69332 RepID=A0A388M0K2_CHABU|nr:hypothetical protein CBR_g46430 [Chara braunii]|eukprot:GBG88061.1 hypothetical protein CBR_g46430 [Chara braunii]